MRALALVVPLLLSANPGPPPLVQMEVKDVVPLKELNQHAVVLVSREDGTVLPLFVDETAAVAIAFRLMKRPTPHPLAHDLLDKLDPSYLVRLPDEEADRVARSALRKLAELDGHAVTSDVEADQRACST